MCFIRNVRRPNTSLVRLIIASVVVISSGGRVSANPFCTSTTISICSETLKLSEPVALGHGIRRVGSRRPTATPAGLQAGQIKSYTES